jgi:hypothetical protein
MTIIKKVGEGDHPITFERAMRLTQLFNEFFVDIADEFPDVIGGGCVVLCEDKILENKTVSVKPALITGSRKHIETIDILLIAKASIEEVLNNISKNKQTN